MRRLLALITCVLAVGIASGGVLASSALAADADATAAPTTGAAPTAAAAALPTAAQIDAYLAGKGSPMAGQGSAFLASGGKWQVDPRLIVAIAGAESNFGAITCAPFNAWGYGCPNGPYEFTSWADGIDTVAQGLRTNYLSEGRTSVALINLKYAPIGAANDPTGLNNHWTINVSRFLIELGGDPNDIDIDDIAGTLLMGATQSALAGGNGEDFGFSEVTADDAAATDPAKPTIEVAPGAPRPLAISVKNTGTKTWKGSSVRLARVDDEARIVGDPFGTITDGGSVAPGDDAKFVVLLAARGTDSGTAATSWRLEGPNGPFGAVIERSIAFAVPPLAAGRAESEITSGDDGTLQIVLRIQNTGSTAWRRDGADRVVLGLRGAAGAQLRTVGWLNPNVPAALLQRDVLPGEYGSFAFRVRGTDAALALQVFTADGWAHGPASIVTLGTVAEDVRAGLADRFAS